MGIPWQRSTLAPVFFSDAVAVSLSSAHAGILSDRKWEGLSAK